ncbi:MULTISPECIES: allophanate hydrolase [unclassified Xanthobacter]|uniref:allophanate hydrolase n=1 Tax=unclassified Xanthobacter TaxID=2623496 RepID=UPI001EDCED40|nr:MULTISPECIES: allophanate hydrolase [unclassified Xanthobacter]
MSAFGAAPGSRPGDDFTIPALHAAYAAGTPVEATIDTLLARHSAASDPGIFLNMESRENLIAQARALGPFDPVAKPLWGIPFAVKDNIDVAGVPTTAACPDFAYVPDTDAPVVARLKAAGGLYVGKTNLDQFATGLVGLRTPYPVPLNAVDPALVPGGSSSGSAVATARRIVSFALGTDTAGSGRVPAALNNIVGLKPSLGALSSRGAVPACRTLDCISVFAFDIADAWSVFDLVAAYDAADPFSRDRDVRGEMAPQVVGIPSAGSIRFFGDDLQATAFAAAVAQVRATGVEVREVDFAPLYAVADMLYQGAWVAERLAAVAPFLKTHPNSLHPVTARIIEGARDLTAVDAFNGFYRLKALAREAEIALDGIDLLCVPTMPTFCTVKEVEADPIGPNARLGTYTNFVNLLDWCGIAVPCGSRADGRPGSITVLARGGGDRSAAAFAARVTGAPPLPPVRAPVSSDIELAVVGAHLSGMALNGELTRLGARLARTVRTAPDYALYLLPDTVPAKPGLLKVGPGAGAAIEVEVWTLPETGFARFVAAIPAPLGLGRIALEDGSRPQGFLVERYAVDAATDITAFGGWRAWCAAQETPPATRAAS